MPIVNNLISRLELSKPGSSISKILRTGTNITVTKDSAKNTYSVVRKHDNGEIFTTLLKKINGKYVPKSVREEYRFGIVSILFKKDGSRLLQIRPCDVQGRSAKINNGFYKTSCEELSLANGERIKASRYLIERTDGSVQRIPNFFTHLMRIRHNDRYRLHYEKYTINDDLAYEKVDKARKVFYNS